MASEFGVKRAFRVFTDNGFREPPNAEQLLKGWIRRLEKYTDDQVIAAANRYADEDNATWPKAGQLVARYLASQELRLTDRSEYDPQVEPATIPPKWEARVIQRIAGASRCPATGTACSSCLTCERMDWSAVPTSELDRHQRWLEGADWDGDLPLAPWMTARIEAHYGLMGIALNATQRAMLDARTDDLMPAEPVMRGTTLVEAYATSRTGLDFRVEQEKARGNHTEEAR